MSGGKYKKWECKAKCDMTDESERRLPPPPLPCYCCAFAQLSAADQSLTDILQDAQLVHSRFQAFPSSESLPACVIHVAGRPCHVSLLGNDCNIHLKHPEFRISSMGSHSCLLAEATPWAGTSDPLPKKSVCLLWYDLKHACLSSQSFPVYLWCDHAGVPPDLPLPVLHLAIVD
jgi:hypothetical protein